MARVGRRLTAGALAAALVGTGAAVLAVAPNAEAATYVLGIDTSHWDHPSNQPIDWVKVSKARSFVIAKATQDSNYADPWFVSDYKNARKAGMVTGAYHFAEPKLPISSAATQARWYVSNFNKAGSFRDINTLPPVLDLECNSTGCNGKTGKLSAANLSAWVALWLKTAQQLSGRVPILYVGSWFYRDNLGSTTQFHGYPLWYPRWRTEEPTLSALPGGWKQWTIWQYSSTISTPGIPRTGHGDQNRFNGTLSALKSFADGRKAVLPPSAPTKPVVALSQGQAKIWWSPPLNPSTVYPVTGYTVSIDGGTQTLAGGQVFVATGLTPGNHTLTVRALNVVGSGTPLNIPVTIPSGAPSSINRAATRFTMSMPSTATSTTSVPVRVTLKRSDSGQAIPNSYVALTVTPDKTAPRVVYTLKTAADGSATRSIRVPVDAKVSVRYTGNTWLQGNVSATRELRVAPSISAKVSRTTVVKYQAFRVNGTTTFAVRGERVFRQTLVKGRWVNSQAAVVASNGSFTFRVVPTARGRQYYRVWLPSTWAHAGSLSSSTSIKVS